MTNILNEPFGAGQSGRNPIPRRGAAKLLASTVGLGCGLGLMRNLQAEDIASTMQYEVNGKDFTSVSLPVGIDSALASGALVSVLVKVEKTLYRANFKIEIEG